MWSDKLLRVWRIKELRVKIFFVLAMLAIFRLAAHIPLPGVDSAALREFFAGNQILGLVNIFSGGGMENFSVVLMGIAPYITASIIFQLLTMIVPSLEEVSKEPGGQEKINRYTRYVTVPLAFLQSYGMISLIRSSGLNILPDVSIWQILTILIVSTAGTVFLMWLGELISEKGIGNGISLMIFAGIIAGVPTALQQVIVVFDRSQIFNIAIFFLLAVVTIIGVVVINEGQRNVPVTYAKQIRGAGTPGGQSTNLPLRVNMAGVIPIIFAISIILFPPMVAQFFLNARSAWLARAAEQVIIFFQDQTIYGILYFALVVGFTYFYTAVVFHPERIAENLQKQGAFVPGIRPGKPTELYLKFITNRILLAGALFLGAIAVLPLIAQRITGFQSLVIGGTGLLIVVSVVIETVKQIESQLTMRDYET